MVTQSFKSIQKQYPNEWVLLGNPVRKETTILGGVVIYHSPDKKEVCYLGRDKTRDFNRIRLVYTGKLQTMRRIGIMKRINQL